MGDRWCGNGGPAPYRISTHEGRTYLFNSFTEKWFELRLSFDGYNFEIVAQVGNPPHIPYEPATWGSIRRTDTYRVNIDKANADMLAATFVGFFGYDPGAPLGAKPAEPAPPKQPKPDCQWCKGTGLYHPLFGPPEPCRECL